MSHFYCFYFLLKGIEIEVKKEKLSITTREAEGLKK